MNIDTNISNEAAEEYQQPVSENVSKKKNPYKHLMTGLGLILIGIVLVAFWRRTVRRIASIG